MKISCSVEVLTLNSAKTLRRCLESLRDFDDIMIIDGNSTDNAVAIAKKFGARIIPQSDSKELNLQISDFSKVRNIGLRGARFKWFLFIDSDEYLSKEAAEEIRSVIDRGDTNDFFVYKLPRKYVVKGKVIERSAMYPNYQVRFFYIPAVEGFVKKVHERIQPKPGYAIGHLIHPEYVPFDDLPSLKQKWLRYAKLQIAHTDISFVNITPYILSNFATFAKYLIKYTVTFFTGSGRRMPFRYEWGNAYYHIRLIREAWKKLIAHIML